MSLHAATHGLQLVHLSSCIQTTRINLKKQKIQSRRWGSGQPYWHSGMKWVLLMLCFMCQTLRECLFGDFCVHISLSCTLLQLRTTIYTSGASAFLCFILPPLSHPLVAKHLPVTHGNPDNPKRVSRRSKNNELHLKCHGTLCAYTIICGSLIQWRGCSAPAAMINARCNDIILRRLW